MTLTQLFFLFCGLVLVPITGLLCVGWSKNQVRPWLQHCVRGCVISLLALIVMGGVARMVFPTYPDPNDRIPEPLALTFTVPVLLISLFFVMREAGIAKESKWVKRSKAGILLLVYCSGVYLSYEGTVWSYRRALPWAASEIEEHYWADPLLPDYSYQLRAKISEEQFFEYVKKFDLSPDSAAEAGEYFYSAQEGDWRMSASYSGGYLEVSAYVW